MSRDRPIEVVAFDGDSTLTTLEGIVWLAERAGADEEVARLTDRAMAGEIPLEAIYAERLARVRPGSDDLAALGDAYAGSLVEDAAAVVAALEGLGVETWVVSAGLQRAIQALAKAAGIPPGRVRAVPYDLRRREPWLAAGAHPLASTTGKREVLREIAAGRRTAIVGDGASDLAARDVAACFVAYGGVVEHAAARAGADAWIACRSLAPALPLLRPDAGVALAGTPHAETWEKGARLLAEGRAGGGCPDGDARPRLAAVARAREQPARLFLPGPTEVSDEILAAQDRRLVGHRSPEIMALLEAIQPRLRALFQTDHRVYVSTSSATGLFEAAARCGIGRRALCCVNGAFSQRWAEVVAANGRPHDVLEVEWGQPVTPALVEAALERADYDAVTVVHNETSTAVTSPVGEIAAVVRARDPEILLLVDTVSSLGGIDVPVDDWGLDVCLTGGQKCLALPPGLAFAAVSDHALARARTIPHRGWYFDWLVFERYLERWQTPTTPAITLLYALDRQLDRILDEEGLEARFERHSAMADHVRGWALDRFDVLAAEGYRSDSVTAVENTRDVDVDAMNAFLADRDMVVSNGYGKLRDVTFRIGHMGDHTVGDMEALTAAIDDFLEAS